jgi:hypothetical protein
MGLFGRIFGTAETAKEIVTSVRDGLDALVFTDEERDGAAAKDRAEARGMIVNWMKTTSGQNLARRFLAMAITMGWLAQYMAANLFAVVAVFMEEPKAFLAASEVMGSYADQMNGAVMLILGFYFAAPHLSAIVPAAIERFGKSPSRGKASE